MSTVSFPAEVFLPHLRPDFEQMVQTWLAQQPKPDQQYTIEQAAKLLKVSAETITTYLGLPAGHRRRLLYVVTHDSNKGKRIPLSAIQDWQQRNNCDAIAEARQTEVPQPHRAARRQRGNA